MKKSLRLTVLVGSILQITLALSGCGGGASTTATPSPTPTPTTPATTNTSFAFLQLDGSANPVLADAYLMNINTGVATKLNSQSAAYNGIRLSPDGTKAVFTAKDSGGYSQIFVAEIANFNNPIQLTSDDTKVHQAPAFSPDGTMIVSAVFDSLSDTWGIKTLPVDGGAETIVITAGPGVAGAGIAGVASPVFTPDGTKIVFSLDAYGGSYPVGVGNCDSISIVNFNGIGLTQLSNPSCNGDIDISPAISPDGTKGHLYARICRAWYDRPLHPEHLPDRCRG